MNWLCRIFGHNFWPHLNGPTYCERCGKRPGR